MREALRVRTIIIIFNVRSRIRIVYRHLSNHFLKLYLTEGAYPVSDFKFIIT